MSEAHVDSEYRLVDIGDGRQLAQFGQYLVDRPYPAAGDPARNTAAWAQADLRFERGPWRGAEGHWVSAADDVPRAWTMRHDGLTFELRTTPSGQVGFFGEQREPWQWIRESVLGLAGASSTAGTERSPASSGADPPSEPPAVLNLFAYTGGATLAAVAAGARVTHVDASRPAVAWARRNAELSGMSDAPIRWIVDDALAFVGREERRGRRYAGIVLDPPSYGHGARGERWTLDERLADLLDACVTILEARGFALLTAHEEGLDATMVAAALRDAFARAYRRDDAATVTGDVLLHEAESGAVAPAGVAARWRGR